jgi:hypothetical protein
MPDLLRLDIPPVALLVPLIVCIGVCSALAIFHAIARLEEARRLRLDPLSVTSYHCRYCTWGVTHMEEECMRFEGDDIVETRRFVCNRCGLPHWIVLRTPILRKVS